MFPHGYWDVFIRVLMCYRANTFPHTHFKNVSFTRAHTLTHTYRHIHFILFYTHTHTHTLKHTHLFSFSYSFSFIHSHAHTHTHNTNTHTLFFLQFLSPFIYAHRQPQTHKHPPFSACARAFPCHHTPPSPRAARANVDRRRNRKDTANKTFHSRRVGAELGSFQL